ncbi:hypothetical protein BKA65DRAFT_475419 [Rhexocercosporidium sp. MPI-PUGE-AT-0058]|nr:hypothetical protein BKA65DRAFT_475419 [Rhexocercosporidium sp. MPI-PUGE-AT-0058]
MGAEQSHPSTSSRHPHPSSPPSPLPVSSLPLTPPTYTPQNPTSRRYPSPKPGHPSRKKRAASPLPIPPEMLSVRNQPPSSRKAKSGPSPLSSRRNSLIPNFVIPSSTFILSSASNGIHTHTQNGTRSSSGLTTPPHIPSSCRDRHRENGSGSSGSSAMGSSSGSEDRRSSERDGEGMSMGLPPVRAGFPFYEEVLLAAEREKESERGHRLERSGEGKRSLWRRSLGGVR